MLSLFFKILIFIVVFSLLILIHELGHFYFAKKAGVKVEEFGLGMPPRLFGKKYGETLYSINWIPFGGFVRLYGEDATDPEVLKNSRSFASKTPWQQIQIICGGVFMNFLLAFFLLSFGFWYGIEPLYSSPEEQLDGIRDGRMELEHGIYFSQTGSQMFPSTADVQVLFDDSGSPVQVPFLIDGKILPYTISSSFLDNLRPPEFSIIFVPRLAYDPITVDPVFDSILNPGDLLLSINERQIFTEEDLILALNLGNTLNFEIYRPDQGVFNLDLNLPKDFVIPELQADTINEIPLKINWIYTGPAQSAGLFSGDIIVSVEGEPISSIEGLNEIQNKSSEGELLEYTILREGQLLDFEIPLGEDSRIGVLLSPGISNYATLPFFEDQALATVTHTQLIQASWQSPLLALSEMKRLGIATVKGFLGVLKDIISGEGVPADVSGPVGIAQVTFISVDQGFGAMIRLIAIISLSLGVINILPIPALDGGRLIFIFYRIIRGRPAPPEFERILHFLGFVLLMFFLIMVTFNDLSLF